MVIVVLRDEVQMVDQPHGLFESWVRDGSEKESGIESLNVIDELRARLPEPGENLFNATQVVPGVVSFSITQVSGCEFGSASEVILNARHPQGFEIKQMSGVFLRRPLFPGLLH
jgi:hypothetical protein